jgi:hypothetical protein
MLAMWLPEKVAPQDLWVSSHFPSAAKDGLNATTG